MKTNHRQLKINYCPTSLLTNAVCHTLYPIDLRPFDLETGMRVASKVGNLPSKLGHARPFRSAIIRYVRDGLTDIQTDRRTKFPLQM